LLDLLILVIDLNSANSKGAARRRIADSEALGSDDIDRTSRETACTSVLAGRQLKLWNLLTKTKKASLNTDTVTSLQSKLCISQYSRCLSIAL
jgi:hypothetical protein